MLYTLVIIYLWIIKMDLIVGNEPYQSYGCYPSVLYIWSGQNSSVQNAADFIAVVDFDENSPTYGQIIKRVSLVSNAKERIGQTGNEPHHSDMSSDGKYLATGGLLSFLSNNKEVFIWSIPDNPLDGPTFLYALDVPGACTDEFLPIGNATFLVSMMCNDSAVSPGDMVLIDAANGSSKSMLQDASSLTGFNPHGFGRLNNGSVFTADYIQPLTLTGTNPSNIVFRNTARHFLPNGKLERTFQFTFPTTPGSTTGLGTGLGFMELKSIPNDPYGRSYVCGTNDNSIYLIGPGMPEPILALDLSVVNGYIKRPSSGIASMFPDGKHALMTFQMRFVLLFNITDAAHPIFLRVFDFCSDPSLNNVYIQPPGSSQSMTFAQYCSINNNITGTHVIVHPTGERRFFVFNYFLHFGLAQFSGTRTVHAFKLNEQLTDFEYDHRFNPNFQFNAPHNQQQETFHSLQAFPHHGVYVKLNKK